MKFIKLFIVLLISSLFINIVYADDYTSFTCDYNIKADSKKFSISLKVDNYDKTSKTGTMTIKYSDDQGKDVFVTEAQCRETVTKCLRTNDNINFFEGGVNISDYISKFDGTCPSIHWYEYDPTQGMMVYISSKKPYSSYSEGEVAASSMEIDGKTTTDENSDTRQCKYTIDLSEDGDNSDNRNLLIVRTKNKSGTYEYKLTMGNAKDIPFNYVTPFVLVFNNDPVQTLKITGDDVGKIITGEECLPKDALYVYSEEGSDNSFVATADLEKAKANAGKVFNDADDDTKGPAITMEMPDINISDEVMPCNKILGPVLTQVVKAGITIIQIAAAILAIIKGMLLLIPAVVAKDADQLKKASKTLVILGVILALVIIFRPLVRMIGTLLEYDISCIV